MSIIVLLIDDSELDPIFHDQFHILIFSIKGAFWYFFRRKVPDHSHIVFISFGLCAITAIAFGALR